MPSGDRSSVRIERVQPFPPPLGLPAPPRSRLPPTLRSLPTRHSWTFPRHAGTVSGEVRGGETDDRGDEEVLGTYVQHPRDANRRLPHRSPRPGAVRGRGRLREGQSLPLLARSPADERERSRTGTAPAAPGVGRQAPASASRPTQPEGDRGSRRGHQRWHCRRRRHCRGHQRWRCRRHQRRRVPGAARARMRHGNHLPHSAGSAAGLRVARSRRSASARCRTEPAVGALWCRRVPPHDHRDRRAGTAVHAAAGHSSTRPRPRGGAAQVDEKEPHPIAGRNNTGKTYLVYTLYGFLKTWKNSPGPSRTSGSAASRSAARYPAFEELSKQIAENGQAELSVAPDALHRERNAAIAALTRRFSEDVLPSVFSSPPEKFDNASITVGLDTQFPRSEAFAEPEDGPSIRYDGTSIFVIGAQPGSKPIHPAVLRRRLWHRYA